jgi:uncharacterized protein (TIGR03435 family)
MPFRSRTLLLTLAFAVTASAQAPSFDVASVRPEAAAEARRPTGVRLLPTGQLTATAVTVHELILRAWGIHESQVIGGPDWIRSERYEIQARVETPPASGIAGMLPMLRTLLAERFGLRVRSESQMLSAYVLRRRDRDRLGPDIRPSTLDCAANLPSPLPNTMTLSADGWPPCGLTLMRTLVGETRQRIELTQAAVPIAELAFRLQPIVGRPVVDQTGLAGIYDLRFVYSQQTANNPAGVASMPDAPDLFTALDRQLGLALASERTAVPVLVIESVERPSAHPSS